MKPFLITAALAAAFFMLASPAPAWGGEEATTWRAGDFIVYRGGCHDAASMTAVAKSDNRLELWTVLLEAGKCFGLRWQLSAHLEAWIAGPFDSGHPMFPPASVWRITDAAQDTEFIWLNDTSGPHLAHREMNL